MIMIVILASPLRKPRYKGDFAGRRNSSFTCSCPCLCHMQEFSHEALLTAVPRGGRAPSWPLPPASGPTVLISGPWICPQEYSHPQSKRKKVYKSEKPNLWAGSTNLRVPAPFCKPCLLIPSSGHLAPPTPSGKIDVWR